MTQCGRCNATIDSGYFCEECLAFFSSLAPPEVGPAVPQDGAAHRERGRNWHELPMPDYGLTIGLSTSDSELARDFFSQPIPASDLRLEKPLKLRYSVDAPARGIRGAYSLFYGGRWIGVVESRGEAVMALLSHLHWKIAQAARAHIFVHAGVVGWKGRAMVLPGRSGAGKTSLVLELLRRGASYLSDEYAIFDSSGSVYPFRRDLHVRAAGGSSRSMFPASALADSTPSAGLPVGMLLFATYVPEAYWHPRRLSPGQALLGLLQNTVAARKTPGEVLRGLSRVVVSAPAFAAERSEARTASREVIDLLEADYTGKGSTPASQGVNK